MCPLCGADKGKTSRAEAEGPGRVRPAWEDPAASFPRNFLDCWIESVIRPARFFAGVPYEAPAARPILYYLLISLVGATFSLWWSSIFTALQLPGWFGSGDPWMAASPAASALVTFFATPFLAFLGLVVWTSLLHLLVAIFARERRGYGATMRVVCYGSGPHVMSVVPFLGSLVGLAWGLALVTIGLREAHRMSAGTAVAVVVIAVLIPLTLLVGAIVMMVAALASIA
ncbi:MAG: YIP1 family protein [Acidobacteriota bacterium]|nr:YIP1 family protein [Acidobacteriota bacterium]